MKITTKDARALVNKRIETINEHIANTQADKAALSKKINEARKLHSKIKLIGQR